MNMQTENLHKSKQKQNKTNSSKCKQTADLKTADHVSK